MVDKVTIDFVARLAKFEEGINKANAKLDQFQAKGTSSAGLLKKAFKTLGPAIAGAFSVAAVKGSLDFADGIANAAEQTGFTTEKIQELRFAAGQTDIEIGALDTAMAKFTKRLGLARQGAGAAAKSYKDLGINLKQSNEAVFKDVVDTLGNMTDDTDRLALATKFFGDEAQRMGVLLAGGNKVLNDYAAQAHSLGLILDDEVAQNASKANDKLSIMSQVLKVQATEALTSIAPLIIDVGNKFIDAAKGVGRFYDRFLAEEGTVGQRQQELASVAEELQRLYKIQEDLTAADNQPSIMDRILGRPAEAERVQEAIDVVEKRYYELIDGTKAANEAGKDTSGMDAQVSSLDKLREALEKTNSSSGKYSETLKLFSEKPKTTFAEDATKAEKLSATYRALSTATSAAKSGDTDSVQKIEAAAAAINALKKSGDVAEQTINDMKATLKEAFKEKSPEVKVKTVIDENGITTYTDEATQKMQEAFDANPPIVRVKLDVEEVTKAVGDVVGSSAICNQVEKTGGRQ